VRDPEKRTQENYERDQERKTIYSRPQAGTAAVTQVGRRRQKRAGRKRQKTATAATVI